LADSSLVDPFRDIANEYEVRNPDVTVSVEYGNSKTLARRISHGAPADVLATSGAKQMASLEKSGDISEDPIAFATNKLAVITAKNNPAGITKFSDLSRPSLRVSLVSPKVPVGHYSRLALSKAHIRNRDILVANDAQGVVSQVRLGKADAGICYVTDVTPKDSGNVFEVVIPDRYNVKATYEVAPLSSTDIATRFAGYVRSGGGQEILAAYGFGRAPA
jgi:molybdate transport system substrate-binding protein